MIKMPCRDCYIPMVNVMSSSKDKHEKFCKCPKYLGAIKHIKIYNLELNFGEILYRVLDRKRK